MSIIVQQVVILNQVFIGEFPVSVVVHVATSLANEDKYITNALTFVYDAGV